MRRKFIISFFCFLNLISAQYKNITESYNDITIEYSKKNNINDKLSCAKKYLDKAKNENLNIEVARAYYMYAISYYASPKKKDKQLIIDYLDLVIKNSILENDDFFPMAAYCEKANILCELFKFNEAIQVYKEGETIAKKRNSDYYYIIRYAIGITKCEELGEIDEGLIIFKECEKSLRKIKNINTVYNGFYLNSLFGISDVYNSKKETDSCKKYYEKGLKESKLFNDSVLINKFNLIKSANLILLKKHNEAIVLINKLKPFINKNLDKTTNPIACEYYLGKAYLGLNDKITAVKYFKKVDSIYQKTRNITPEFVDGYKVIIDYYKEIKNEKEQLKYLNTFVEIEDKFKKRYRDLYKIIQKKYDVPNMFEDKNNQISFQKKCFLLLLFVSIILVIYLIHVKNKEISNQKQFKKILEGSINWKIETNETEDERKIRKKSNEIREDTINDILKKLKEFEKQNGFLEKSVNAKVIADDFNTNVKYISNIINDYKGKKVTIYINDLRIEYAIKALQNDKKIIKYTIESLANEFGFNNVDSFNKSFFNKTGMKPTFFINELKKENEKQV